MKMGRKRLMGQGILFIILLLPCILFSLPMDDHKFNFNKESITPDKSEEIFKYSPPQSRYEFNFLGLLLKTILSLGIISGIIYFILRFFFRAKGLVYSGRGLFRVIGTHILAPNRYIQLIEIGNTLLLLGITENGINLLTKIDDRETIELVKAQADQSQMVERVSFHHHLKEFLKGFHPKELFDEGLSKEKKVAFLRDQQAKLKRLG